MKFPAFSAQATAEQFDANGKQVRFACWGASDISREDAYATAVERARRVLNKLLAGGSSPPRYPYGTTPLREGVKQEFFDVDGTLIAAVTTNAYGSLVLNTAGVMFVDIDFSPIRFGEQLRHAVGKRFNRGGLSPEAVREQDACERVGQFLRSRAVGARGSIARMPGCACW